MKQRLDDVACSAGNDDCDVVSAFSTIQVTRKVIKNGINRWNMSTCEIIGEPIFAKLDNEVTCVASSPNGKMILMRSADGPE